MSRARVVPHAVVSATLGQPFYALIMIGFQYVISLYLNASHFKLFQTDPGQIGQRSNPKCTTLDEKT